MTPALSRALVHRYAEGAAPLAREDFVVVEEPLEIRVGGDTLAVTMRTPGDDAELAAGFLLAEGLIRARADLGQIAHCGRPGDEGWGNVIDVLPAAGSAIDLEQTLVARRGTLTSSACGVCGRRTIEDLLARCPVLAHGPSFERRVIENLTTLLRGHQKNFEQSGGLHAAGLADETGRFLVVREDVGRHNAVDKLLGRLLLDGELPRAAHALVVSGRTSFEIVQKALVARIPLVVGVSAPSSLAITTAERANLTLIGFARSASFNVYSGLERVRG
jgi:FdhD protein